MSAAAKPMQVLYLTIASPALMLRAAILCPGGTWLRVLQDSPGTRTPMPTLVLVTSTLSAACKRMHGPTKVFCWASICDVVAAGEERKVRGTLRALTPGECWRP